LLANQVGNVFFHHTLQKKLTALVIEIVEVLFKNNEERIPFTNTERWRFFALFASKYHKQILIGTCLATLRLTILHGFTLRCIKVEIIDKKSAAITLKRRKIEEEYFYALYSGASFGKSERGKAK